MFGWEQTSSCPLILFSAFDFLTQDSKRPVQVKALNISFFEWKKIEEKSILISKKLFLTNYRHLRFIFLILGSIILKKFPCNIVIFHK